MKNMHPHLRGIIYALTGYTLWVIVDAFMKRVAEEHIPAYEILFVMCPLMAGTIFCLEFLKQRNTEQTFKTLWPKNIKQQIGVSLMGFSSQYSCVIALAHLPLNNFYVAVFTAPMTMSILAYFFLKEPLSKKKVVALLIGFSGVVLAEWPSETNQGDFLGYLAAFSSATFYAISVVWSRHITQSESAMSLTFFNALQQTALCGLLFIILGNGVMLTPYLLLILIAAALVNASGNLCSYLSVTYAPTSTAGAYHYSQLLTGALVAYLFWNEVPTLRLIAGAFLITISGLSVLLTLDKLSYANHGVKNS